VDVRGQGCHRGVSLGCGDHPRARLLREAATEGREGGAIPLRQVTRHLPVAAGVAVVVVAVVRGAAAAAVAEAEAREAAAEGVRQ
jgi:hypothetical protein